MGLTAEHVYTRNVLAKLVSYSMYSNYSPSYGSSPNRPGFGSMQQHVPNHQPQQPQNQNQNPPSSAYAGGTYAGGNIQSNQPNNLYHSASSPSLIQSPVRTSTFSYATSLSPAPQSPLTTADLNTTTNMSRHNNGDNNAATNNSFQNGWGGMQFGNLANPAESSPVGPNVNNLNNNRTPTALSQTQQSFLNQQQNTGLGGFGEKKYIPSHLSQMHRYTPDRSSPLATEPPFTARENA